MRYYWIKLHDNFFDRIEVKKLRMMPGGDTLTIIYLKLLLLTMNSGGKIPFEGIETNIFKELALKINEEELSIQMAMNALAMMKLLEEKEGEVELAEHNKVTGAIAPKPSKKALPQNVKKKHGSMENVLLSDEEYEKLKEFYGSEGLLKNRIEDMSLYCKTKGKTYKDYYAALMAWGRKDGVKPKNTKKEFSEEEWL